jgi:membrane protein implicated in regulation of membrane protease activity
MEQYVYFGCFLFGLLFTVCSVFFGHHIGGHDGHFDLGTGGHAEAGYEHSGMPGISPFSPTTICSFLTAFGAFGMIFSSIKATRSVWVSTPLSALGGLLIAAGVLWLFSAMFNKTQSSSEGHIGALVGRTATVITPIPAAGVGEIAYVQGGSRYTAPAREEKGVAVANGQSVKITRVAESQFFVSII